MNTLKHFILRDELTSWGLYVVLAMLVIVDDPPQWVRITIAGCTAWKAYRSDPNPVTKP